MTTKQRFHYHSHSQSAQNVQTTPRKPEEVHVLQLPQNTNPVGRRSARTPRGYSIDNRSPRSHLLKSESTEIKTTSRDDLDSPTPRSEQKSHRRNHSLIPVEIIGRVSFRSTEAPASPTGLGAKKSPSPLLSKQSNEGSPKSPGAGKALLDQSSPPESREKTVRISAEAIEFRPYSSAEMMKKSRSEANLTASEPAKPDEGAKGEDGAQLPSLPAIKDEEKKNFMVPGEVRKEVIRTSYRKTIDLKPRFQSVVLNDDNLSNNDISANKTDFFSPRRAPSTLSKTKAQIQMDLTPRRKSEDKGASLIVSANKEERKLGQITESAPPPTAGDKVVTQKSAEIKTVKPRFGKTSTEFHLDSALGFLGSNSVSFDFLKSLKVRLSSMILLRKFLERSGFKSLGFHLEKSDSLSKLIILEILENGFKDKQVFKTLVSDSPHSSIVNSIAVATSDSNEIVKENAYRILSSLSNWAESYQLNDFNYYLTIKNAMDYKNYKTNEGHLYDDLIRGLKNIQNPKCQYQIVTTINKFFNKCPDLEERKVLNSRFEFHGFSDILKEIQSETQDPLLTEEISSYFDDRKNDEEKYDGILKKVTDLHYSWKEDKVYKKLCNNLISKITPKKRIKRTFYEVLCHLLVLQTDEEVGLQKWQVIERLTGQLAQHKDMISLNNERDTVSLQDLLISREDIEKEIIDSKSHLEKELEDLKKKHKKLLENHEKQLEDLKSRFSEKEAKYDSEILSLKHQLHDNTIKYNQKITNLHLKLIQRTRTSGSPEGDKKLLDTSFTENDDITTPLVSQKTPRKSPKAIQFQSNRSLSLSEMNVERTKPKPNTIPTITEGSETYLSPPPLFSPPFPPVAPGPDFLMDTTPSPLKTLLPSSVPTPKPLPIVPNSTPASPSRFAITSPNRHRPPPLSHRATISNFQEIEMEAVSYRELLEKGRQGGNKGRNRNLVRAVTEARLSVQSANLQTTNLWNPTTAKIESEMQDMSLAPEEKQKMDKILLSLQKEKERLDMDTKKIYEFKRKQENDVGLLKEEKTALELKKHEFESSKKRFEENVRKFEEQKLKFEESKKTDEEKRSLIEAQIQEAQSKREKLLLDSAQYQAQIDSLEREKTSLKDLRAEIDGDKKSLNEEKLRLSEMSKTIEEQTHQNKSMMLRIENEKHRMEKREKLLNDQKATFLTEKSTFSMEKRLFEKDKEKLELSKKNLKDEAKRLEKELQILKTRLQNVAEKEEILDIEKTELRRWKDKVTEDMEIERRKHAREVADLSSKNRKVLEMVQERDKEIESLKFGTTEKEKDITKEEQRLELLSKRLHQENERIVNEQKRMEVERSRLMEEERKILLENERIKSQQQYIDLNNSFLPEERSKKEFLDNEAKRLALLEQKLKEDSEKLKSDMTRFNIRKAEFEKSSESQKSALRLKSTNLESELATLQTKRYNQERELANLTKQQKLFAIEKDQFMKTIKEERNKLDQSMQSFNIEKENLAVALSRLAATEEKLREEKKNIESEKAKIELMREKKNQAEQAVLSTQQAFEQTILLTQMKLDVEKEKYLEELRKLELQLQHQEEKHMLEKNIFQSKIEQLENEKSDLLNEIEKLKKDIRDFANYGIAVFDGHQKEVSSNLIAQEKEIQSARQEISISLAELEREKSEIAKKTSEVAHQKAVLLAEKESFDKEKLYHQELKTQFDNEKNNFQDMKHKFDEEKNQYQGQVENFNTEKKKLRNETDSLQKDKESLKLELQQYSKELQNLKVIKSEIDTEHEQMVARRDEIEREREFLSSEMSKFLQQQEVNDLKKRVLQETEQEIAEKKLKLNSEIQDIEEEQELIKDLKQKIISENTILQSEMEQIESQRSNVEKEKSRLVNELQNMRQSLNFEIGVLDNRRIRLEEEKQLLEKEEKEISNKRGLLSQNLVSELVTQKEEIDTYTQQLELSKLELAQNQKELYLEQQKYEKSKRDIEIEKEQVKSKLRILEEDKTKYTIVKELNERNLVLIHKQKEELENKRESLDNLVCELKEYELTYQKNLQSYKKKKEELDNEFSSLTHSRHTLEEEQATLAEERQKHQENMDRLKEDLLLLSTETARLSALREQNFQEALSLEAEQNNTQMARKKLAESGLTLQKESLDYDIQKQKLLGTQLDIEEKKKQHELAFAALELEEKKLEEQREEQKAEVGMLEEETQWLMRKKAENIKLIVSLDEQEDYITKRKRDLELNETLYKEDLKSLEAKKKKLKEDTESLDEEAKWIESKREEHVARAQELDEEKKWLDTKQKELEEFARLIGVETEDVATPEAIQAFEEAKLYISNGNIAKFTDIIAANSEIVNFVESEGHNTLLHWAVAYKRLEMAKILISNGATQFTNDLELTPYGIASLGVDEGFDMSFLDLKLLLKPTLL